MMQFELVSLKQKQMESSFAHLEKEKKWLETNRSEEKKQKGGPEDKIFRLEMELEKATSCLGKKNPAAPSLDSKEDVVEEKQDIGQELLVLRESLVAHKQRIRALEGKQEEMVKQLKSVEKGQRKAFSQISEAHQRAADSRQASQVSQEERGRLLAGYNSFCLEKTHLEDQVDELKRTLELALADRERLLQEKVALREQVQHVTLELECSQKQQEGLSGQVSALQVELLSAKTQIHQWDEEKVRLKKELESARQVNVELSSEAAESRQRVEASSEKLQRLEAEKEVLDSRIQVLEEECGRFPGEKDRSGPPRQLAGQTQEEEIQALQESCESLRESQATLQREKELLWARCLELEEALQGKQRETGSRLAGDQDVSRQKGQRELATSASETAQEELETTLLREADTELVSLQEELQDAWNMLRTRDAELESSRSQFSECCSEKQRLGERVTSLEEQLAEKEQALRELKQKKSVDGPELQNKAPSSESKAQHRGVDGKGAGSPQRDQESLKQQHRLVTEQLKDLFRQKQQEAGGSGAPMEPPTGPGMPTAAKSTGPQEGGQTESLEVSTSHGETLSLQQQLKEKTERISSMAAEIQALKQKNESLMKAKLRFQQQIQEIRRLSKHVPERSPADRRVPRLSLDQGQDLQSPGSPPQSDEPAACLHGGENLQKGLPGLCLPAGPGDQQSLAPPTPATGGLPSPRSADSPPQPCLGQARTGAGPAAQDPRGSAEGEGALLLSPRPFGLQRAWSPFKLSPEPPDN